MKMQHPDSKVVLDVADEYVAMYESQGWAEKKPAPKK